MNMGKVIKEEAETHDWWDDFLHARMIAIQSMLVLEVSEENIATQIACPPDHAARLIITAKARQS